MFHLYYRTGGEPEVSIFRLLLLIFCTNGVNGLNTLPTIRGAGVFISQQAAQRHFHDGLRTPFRTVEGYELELYDGDGGLMQLNGREYPVKRGAVLVALPGDRRCSTLPFRCSFIRLGGMDAEMEKLLQEVAGVTYTERSDSFDAAFANVRAWFLSDDPFDRLAAAGELFRILQMIRCCRRKDGGIGEGDVLLKAQNFIEQHYREELSVDDIAQACHVSASYLHRLFAQHLQLTPHVALIQRRMTAAKTLLADESFPIAEIAWRCGFNSPSYFSDCFRRQTGLSPGEYRDSTTYQL